MAPRFVFDRFSAFGFRLLVVEHTYSENGSLWKLVGHGSETGFLQGFSRVSLVFLGVFFGVSPGFL